MQQVAKNIKKFRNLHNYSQNSFAELLDISREHLSKVETTRRYPSLQLLFRMADILNIDVKELFETSE